LTQTRRRGCCLCVAAKSLPLLICRGCVYPARPVRRPAHPAHPAPVGGGRRVGGAPGGHPRQPGEPERSDRTVQLPRSAAEGFQRQHHAHGVGRADKTRRCGSGRAVAWWWARRLAISALSLLVPPGHPRASRRWIPCPPRLSRGGGTPRHAACSDAAMWRTNEARPGNQQVPGRQPSPLGASPAAEQVPLWGAGPRDAQPRQRFRLWAASDQWPVASGLRANKREAASDHLQFRIRMYLPQPYWTRCTEKEAATGLSRAQILLLSSFGQLRHVPN